jgi:hypothetical protein
LKWWNFRRCNIKWLNQKEDGLKKEHI